MLSVFTAGARGNKVAMGHLDRTIHDHAKLLEFADDSKCYLEFDLFGIESSHYQMDDKMFMPNDGERLRRIKVILYCIKKMRVCVGGKMNNQYKLALKFHHAINQ